jgi:hypothetical protein
MTTIKLLQAEDGAVFAFDAKLYESRANLSLIEVDIDPVAALAHTNTLLANAGIAAQRPVAPLDTLRRLAPPPVVETAKPVKAEAPSPAPDDSASPPKTDESTQVLPPSGLVDAPSSEPTTVSAASIFGD